MTVESSLLERVRVDAESEMSPRRASGEQRILVVDDEARNRDLICRALSGFQVLEAETGFEALHILTMNADVKLVLLDMRMPGQHGLQTLKELKRLNPNIPVLVITAYAGEVPTSLIVNGLVAGIIDKPFSVRDLTRAVEKVLVDS